MSATQPMTTTSAATEKTSAEKARKGPRSLAGRATALVGAMALAAGGIVAADIATPTPAAAASLSFTPLTSELSNGDSGAEVSELQVRIAGYASDNQDQAVLHVDGEFGAATEAALKRYQAAAGVEQTGVVDGPTRAELNGVAQDDGSTINFNWDEFASPDCGCFTGGAVGEEEVLRNVRVQMFKLEALRGKIGSPITVTSGFRTEGNNSAVGGVPNSLHLYGIATDIVTDVSIEEVRGQAQTSGFSGIITYPGEVFNHVDSTGERPQYGHPAEYLQYG